MITCIRLKNKLPPSRGRRHPLSRNIKISQSTCRMIRKQILGIDDVARK
nr:MAG TPA: hypothetical protein [Caudoviricetes sp.]